MPGLGCGVLLLVAASACGGERGPYDIVAYWEELARTHCARMTDCCTDSEYYDWWTGDDVTQDCFEMWKEPFNAEEIRAGLASGELVFDAAAARACVTALDELACSEFNPSTRFRETYCASPPVYGFVPEGGACTMDEQCADQNCYGNACRLATAAEDEPCSDTGPYCMDNMNCFADSFCHPGASEGSQCRNDYHCRDAWCKSPADGGYCYRACDGVD